MFLDIQMPTLTGTQFLRTLKDPPMVIFTTAYEQYALEGFELDVIDYLMKPIPFDRFVKAVNKAHDLFKLKGASKELGFFFVHSEYREIKIAFSDIVYVEGLKDYVKIYLLSNTRPVITRMSMKSLEEKLPADKFVRVHKSFIVSLNKITSIRKGRISMLKAQIPISEHFKENLYKFIDPKSLH